MRKEILINLEPMETRAAILEDGELVELLIERPIAQRVAGNIYKGRVENVLPGMEAAFVNIGLEKNGFLYVGDTGGLFRDEDDPGEKVKGKISELLKPRQEVLVQVVKEALGTKGARVTTHISLPGRYLVLMPTTDYVGVSRRIGDEKERGRLRELADRNRPAGIGVIVRTAAEGAGANELLADMEFLVRLWGRIQRRAKALSAPALLHKDLGLSFRIVRDMLNDDVERLWVDSRSEYERVLELCDMMSPGLKRRIKFYAGRQGSLFEAYNLDAEIEKMTRRKVWLKSGGYLVIDQTEALTVIDVNTGKYVGSTNLADTVLHTNLEAVEAIARQMRLRDLTGIIVVDFIDMDRPEDRQKVLSVLEEAVRRDRTKVHILGLTHLGLVEMTRKKVGPGPLSMLMRTCPYCDGRGRVLSEESMSQKVRREIKGILRKTPAEALLVEVNPAVAALLIGTGGVNLRELEKETGRHIYIRGSAERHIDAMEVRAIGSREEVERKARPVVVGEVLDVRVEEPHVTNVADGIARVEGYVIDVEAAAALVGERVRVEITGAFRTYAKARLVRPLEKPADHMSEGGA